MIVKNFVQIAADCIRILQYYFFFIALKSTDL